MVEEFLEASADASPDKVALVCGGRRFTYREIEERANRQAHQLMAAGVKRGDRVAIYLENSVEAVTAVFGALKAGAVFIMINPSTKPEKLRYILDDSGAKALIDTRQQLDETLPARRPARQGIDIDLAALIYTSGSTGRPKGVMLTHLNIISAANSITTYLENTPDDIILNVLPMSFDYGLYQLLMAFKIGGTLVLERSFIYPFAVIETILREKVTGLPLVPTIAAILLQMDLAKFEFPHLRYISNTAAALPAAHIAGLRRAFPRAKLFSMYGLTECKRVSYLPPDQLDIRPGSVGRGMPNEEVYIVDERGERVSAGVVGELVVRGSNVMKGYWNLPEETERVLRPGPIPGERVLYTGDLFRADEEGYLYFVGRKDDIIKSRGEKVSPREVENALCSMAGIAEAAVIGVPDETLGEAIHAFVVVRSGTEVSEREILRHCAQNLEDFMMPKRVEIVASLPKSPNGKVDRRALQ